MARHAIFEGDRDERSLTTVAHGLEDARHGIAVATSLETIELQTHLAEAYRRTGDLDRALETYTQCLRVWTQLQRPNRICWCLWGIGTTLRVMGRFRAAMRWLRQAAEVARSSGERSCYLWANAEIAEVSRIVGKRRQSLPDHLALLEQFSRERDVKGICWARTGIAQIFRMESHHQMASAHFQAALAESQNASDLVNTGYALRGLAEIAKERGRLEVAMSHAEGALEAFTRKSYPTGRAYALKTLTDLSLRAGEHEKARALSEESLALFTKIGKRRGIAFALTMRAHVAAVTESLAAAAVLYSHSRLVFRQIGVGNLAMFEPSSVIGVR